MLETVNFGRLGNENWREFRENSMNTLMVMAPSPVQKISTSPKGSLIDSSVPNFTVTGEMF